MQEDKLSSVMQLDRLRVSYRYNSEICWRFFKAVKHFKKRSSLICLVALWAIEDFWLIDNFASYIIFIPAQ